MERNIIEADNDKIQPMNINFGFFPDLDRRIDKRVSVHAPIPSTGIQASKYTSFSNSVKGAASALINAL